MTHTNTVVVLDVDGVLYPYSDNLALVAVAHLGRPATDFPPAETWNFFKDQWNMTLEEYLELVDIGVANYNLIHRGAPYEFSIEGVHALLDLGVEVHIATDMGTEGDPKGHRKARTAWLNACGSKIAELAVTFTSDKAGVATKFIERGNVVFALEDKVENYRSLNAAGAICFLINRPWNQFEPDARRVDTILEFAEIVRQGPTWAAQRPRGTAKEQNASNGKPAQVRDAEQSRRNDRAAAERAQRDIDDARRRTNAQKEADAKTFRLGVMGF